MTKSKLMLSVLISVFTLLSSNTKAQVDFYRSGSGEIILSGADVMFNNQDVNTNMRFTMFFHSQQRFNLDLGRFIGFYTGFGIRNIGLITEDLYQDIGFMGIDETHPDWDKNTKIKRRSYSLGFPIAVKLGNMDKKGFFYGGAEYEWMFHYKQKLFIDGNKYKFSEWASNRVNPWVPSVFAGIQFPSGFNLKFKYYLDDFLNPGFTGVDFGEDVDYSQFQTTGIWYVSLSFILNKDNIPGIPGNSSGEATEMVY